ncbi:hypothetical protein [Lysinibacillus xylanilyticus]|uniref:Uncharacterized protein n=1 Tax=Lysinibacillus xylanilyticus TaxID=582475 RepID=A0ABT4ETP7_9BACI|nr:hypothetical protein [Lysinibacillus xylanilyticus]MCY9549047.1 hypothetical protein [Lysinibacillus xylanilyticus]MED3804752.1 hypothetical protein [Lysinibacillus xylanilyticus]
MVVSLYYWYPSTISDEAREQYERDYPYADEEMRKLNNMKHGKKLKG